MRGGVLSSVLGIVLLANLFILLFVIPAQPVLADCVPGFNCWDCPNGFCGAPDENCSNCPQDCGVCQDCGDGACTGTEDVYNCAEDCGRCGDGVVSVALNEVCDPPNQQSQCGVNQVCSADCGSCVATAYCGDGSCDAGENADSCSVDCSAVCGDGFCTHDETYGSCPGDCPCVPECGTRECGSDGCEGSCGVCSDDEPICVSGYCQECRFDFNCPAVDCSDLVNDSFDPGCYAYGSLSSVCAGGVCSTPDCSAALSFAAVGTSCPLAAGVGSCDGAGLCGCPVGLSLCAGSCVNLSSSVSHCGSCGTSCGAGQSCVDHVCTITTTYFRDGDGDKYGNGSLSVTSTTGPPAGYVANSDDCDDGNKVVYPGAAETCNGVDDDCNDVVDDGVCVGGSCQFMNDAWGCVASPSLSLVAVPNSPLCIAPAGTRLHGF